MRHWKMQFNVAGISDKMDCFEFKMTIDNLSKLKDGLSSPTFKTTRFCKTIWQITVEVASVGVGLKMRIGLKRTDSSICSMKASMFFEIQDDGKETYWRSSIEHDYNSQSEKYCFSDYLVMPNLQHTEPEITGKVLKLFTDKIIIRGNVLVKAKEHICCGLKKDHELLHESLDLQCDFKNLYYNHKFSDVEFCFTNGKLLAHKSILSSRSSVFEKNFEHNPHQNVINVTDVDKSVFDIFLLFLYSGSIGNKKPDLIIPLYIVAHKYEVHKLSKICSSILASDITIKTVTRILELVSRHEDSDLMEAAMDFVCENFHQVSQTPDWKALLSSNPSFASIVLKRVSKSLKNQKSNSIITIS